MKILEKANEAGDSKINLYHYQSETYGFTYQFFKRNHRFIIPFVFLSKCQGCHKRRRKRRKGVCKNRYPNLINIFSCKM